MALMAIKFPLTVEGPFNDHENYWNYHGNRQHGAEIPLEGPAGHLVWRDRNDVEEDISQMPPLIAVLLLVSLGNFSVYLSKLSQRDRQWDPN